MSLIKLAFSFKGVAAVGKELAANPLTRNAAIGVAGGAALGAASSEKGHRLGGALAGGVGGGVLGAGGTLLHQGHKASKYLGSSYKEGLKAAVDVNKKTLGSMSTVYKLNK